MEIINFCQKLTKLINILVIAMVIYIILAVLSFKPVFWIIISFVIMAWYESGGYIVWRPKIFWEFMRSLGRSDYKASDKF
jgi:Fe2+ transport system protein B